MSYAQYTVASAPNDYFLTLTHTSTGAQRTIRKEKLHTYLESEGILFSWDSEKLFIFANDITNLVGGTAAARYLYLLQNFLKSTRRVVDVGAGQKYLTIEAGISAATMLSPTATAPVTLRVAPGEYTNATAAPWDVPVYTSIVGSGDGQYCGARLKNNGANTVLRMPNATSVNVIKGVEIYSDDDTSSTAYHVEERDSGSVVVLQDCRLVKKMSGNGADACLLCYTSGGIRHVSGNTIELEGVRNADTARRYDHILASNGTLYVWNNIMSFSIPTNTGGGTNALTLQFINLSGTCVSYSEGNVQRVSGVTSLPVLVRGTMIENTASVQAYGDSFNGGVAGTLSQAYAVWNSSSANSYITGPNLIASAHHARGVVNAGTGTTYVSGGYLEATGTFQGYGMEQTAGGVVVAGTILKGNTGPYAGTVNGTYVVDGFLGVTKTIAAGGVAAAFGANAPAGATHTGWIEMRLGNQAVYSPYWS